MSEDSTTTRIIPQIIRGIEGKITRGVSEPECTCSHKKKTSGTMNNPIKLRTCSVFLFEVNIRYKRGKNLLKKDVFKA